MIWPPPKAAPLRYFLRDGSEAGCDLARKLDAIYAKPQSQWTAEECTVIASLQRLAPESGE
jgi:hypothetical protein